MPTLPKTKPSSITSDDWKGLKASVAKFAESSEVRSEREQFELRKKKWNKEDEQMEALTDDELKSKEEFFILLTELKKTFPGIKLPKDANDLSNEVYGPQAMIYLTCGDMQERRALEDILEKEGFPPTRAYCCLEGNCHEDAPTLTVRVKYFKGWHWDE